MNKFLYVLATLGILILFSILLYFEQGVKMIFSCIGYVWVMNKIFNILMLGVTE